MNRGRGYRDGGGGEWKEILNEGERRERERGCQTLRCSENLPLKVCDCLEALQHIELSRKGRDKEISHSLTLHSHGVTYKQ